MIGRLKEKILKWWNNLSFCKAKKEEWISDRMTKLSGSDTKLFKEIKWPETIFHTSLNDFSESDWVYNSGDRCERYICWFFGWRTERCTVLERVKEWVPQYCPTEIGASHPEGYITSYKVKDDDGDIHNTVQQNDLSF